jgi:hypothetical protein
VAELGRSGVRPLLLVDVGPVEQGTTTRTSEQEHASSASALAR